MELLNFGTEPIQLMGFSLTDDAFAKGRTLVTPLAVEPGERVLVVSPAFDVSEVSDGLLPGGVRLVRLDGALSLRNDGTALFLRDAQGRRVAESPSMAPEAAGQCIAQVSGTGTTVAEFAPDPRGGCTPGTATTQAPP